MVQTKGTYTRVYYNDINTYADLSAYGKEILLSDSTFDRNAIKAEIRNASNAVLKTYTITRCDTLTSDENVYVKWIEPFGTYKYYLLNKASETEETQEGNAFNRENLFSQITSSSSFGVIESRRQVKTRQSIYRIAAGVKAADDDLYKHLRSLSRSLKQWIWDGQQWVEVNLANSSVSKSLYSGNPEMNFEFIYSPLYVQSI
jgi:hypothetical protein